MPKAQDASYFCRVCKVNFKLNGTYLSCENLFKSPMASAGNLSLSKIITGTLEVCLNSEPYLSSRVFSKYALKIRNAAERLNFIRENINVPQENFIATRKAATNSTRKIRIPESCGLKDLQSVLDQKQEREEKEKASKAKNRQIAKKLWKVERSDHCYLPRI